MNSHSDFHQWLLHRKQTICHRQLVVLPGDEQWGIQTAKHIIHTLQLKPKEQILTVGLPEFEINITNKQYKRYLGQEFEAIVYNAWQGIRANAIAAVSGTIKNNGLMILLCPDFETWPTYQDPELDQRLSYGYQNDFSESRFIKWLIHSVQNDPEVSVLTEGSFKAGNMPQPKPALTDESIFPCITQDQGEAVDAIIKVATGHRNRPLVLQADRGRGKSAAIGIAAAKLSTDFNKNILLTAPHKDNCRQSVKHFDELEGPKDKFTFLPIDVLTETQPEADLVIIDEAAALPVETLKQICAHYRRIVFSTTIHGYEGSGRGFEIRFKQHLFSTFPQAKQIHLKTPIRWHANDSLEKFWFNTLCFSSPTLQGSLKTANFEGLITKEELIESPHLLTEIFNLLVDAHYQTSPDSLVSMLDSPEARVFVCIKNHHVVATAIAHMEGSDLLSGIAQDIAYGKRRVNGHLLAQKLGYLTGDKEQVLLSFMRIVRIAATQEQRRTGLGSTLLSLIKQHCLEEGLHYLGASFGAETGLLTFWTQNGFSLVNLGHKKETATGEYNAIVLQPLHKDQISHLEQMIDVFFQDFTYQLISNFKNLSSELVKVILEQASSSVALHNQQKKELTLFSQNCRSLDITQASINRLALTSSVYEKLTLNQTELLIKYALQRLPNEQLISLKLITGKKDLETQLRKIVSIAIKNE